MIPSLEPENEKLASRSLQKDRNTTTSSGADLEPTNSSRTVLGELPTNQRLGSNALHVYEDETEGAETISTIQPVNAPAGQGNVLIGNKRPGREVESPGWRKRARAEARREINEENTVVEPEQQVKDESKENQVPATEAQSQRSHTHTLPLEERLQLALSRDTNNRFEAAKMLQHDDLDSDYRFDPLMVQEYEEDIFDNLYKSQDAYLVDGDYISKQPELGWDQRGIVINWLISVHAKFRLVSETLFIAINLMDRYLERKIVPLSELQKVGLTCLFIATKYEEVMCPAVQLFAYMANLEGPDLVETEKDILSTVEWSIVYTNPLNFLRRISKIDDYNNTTRTFAKFLLEVSLMIPKLIEFKPSTIAAAATCLSQQILNTDEKWDDNAIFYSGGYLEEDLEPLMAVMVDYLAGPIYHPDLFKKFSSRKFLKASVVCREWAKAETEQN